MPLRSNICGHFLILVSLDQIALLGGPLGSIATVLKFRQNWISTSTESLSDCGLTFQLRSVW